MVCGRNHPALPPMTVALGYLRHKRIGWDERIRQKNLGYGNENGGT